MFVYLELKCIVIDFIKFFFQIFQISFKYSNQIFIWTFYLIASRGSDTAPDRNDFETRVRNATDRARGLVIRDDEHLLRQSVRKQESRRRQSARKWAARESSVKKQIADRQRRRTENIESRRQQRLEKKKARRARR